MTSSTAEDARRSELPSWRAKPDAMHGRFEGAALGSPVSGFVVDAAAGEGPALHWHPYAETFVLLAGAARFVRGEQELVAAAGDVVVVPPHTPHSFAAVGPERFRCVAIHGAPTMEQTFIG